MKRTIYFMSNKTCLRKQGESLLAVVDGKRQNYPLHQIQKIVLFGNIQVSTQLLKSLSEFKIPIMFCGYGGKYYGMFLPPNHNVGKLRILQQEYFKKKGLSLAKKLIVSASQNKIVVLKRYFKRGKIEVEKNIEAIKKLIEKIENVESVSSLLGIEGNIMKIYYASFPHIIPSFKFDGRYRNPPKDEINCLLSFGNMILYYEIHSRIQETGLDSFIGFYHTTEGDKPSLALDISEVFKQLIVDSIIFDGINKKQIKDNMFQKQGDICLLNNLGKTFFLRQYEKKINTYFTPKNEDALSYRQNIRRELYKLIKEIDGEKKYKPFRMY